jgi:hypothetical protein
MAKQGGEADDAEYSDSLFSMSNLLMNVRADGL